jgi:aspartyl-tRNA synthetase
MASFYTSTIKVNEVPKEPAAVAAQFAPLFSAFPDWHWEIRNLVVDGDYIAVHFTVAGTHRGVFQGIEATGIWDHTDMDAVMRQIGQGEAHR